MARSAEAEELLTAGRVDAAIALFQQALAENPADTDAVRGLARAAERLGLHREAEAVWLRLHELDPEDRDGLIHAGQHHQRLGRHRRAIDCYDRIAARDPADHDAQTARLQCLLYADPVDAREREGAQAAWGALRPVPGAGSRSFGNAPDPDRPLHIGYLSSDFRAQPTGMAMIPVLHFHDRSRFRIHSYVDVERSDGATEELRRRSDVWRDVKGIDDAGVAAMIADDGIDILVVLTPHMDRNRPFVCRHRPAPVQATFHDPCSTFIPEIDYFIGDFVISPKSTGELFSERVLRLPCWTVQAFPAEAPAVSRPPRETNGFVTFGCFNNPVKLTDTVIALWSRVMRAVPESRIYLKYYDFFADPAVADRIRTGFAANGISGDRIALHDRPDPRSGHFAHYDRVDIALDPFPFNGVTTTFEALLMGTPVVALMGDRLVARSAASLLHSAGVPELVAGDPQHYVELATALALDPDRLPALRDTLRDRVKGSRLVDARRYTRNLERYYRAVWRRWCEERKVEAGER